MDETKYYAPGQNLAFALGPDRDVFVLRAPKTYGEPSTLFRYDLDGNELSATPAPSEAQSFVLRSGATPVFSVLGKSFEVTGLSWDGELHDCGSPIRWMAAGPEGRIAVLTDATLQIWAKGEREVEMPGHGRGWGCIAWAGDRIVTGGMDKRLTVRSTDGERLADRACPRPRMIVVHDDVVHVAGGNGDLSAWFLADLTKAAPAVKHEWEGAGGRCPLHTVQVHGRRVYTGADDKHVRCFEAGRLVWRTEAGGHFLVADDRIIIRDFGLAYTFTELNLNGERL